jgi:hypothetical protein
MSNPMVDPVGFRPVSDEQQLSAAAKTGGRAAHKRAPPVSTVGYGEVR